MNHQDKLFNQIKKASQQSEAKDFPAMDKVWSRVTEKLDQKVLKKENKLWKKIAIAASFLLLFTVGYQIFKTKETVIVPEQEAVTTVSKKPIVPKVISQENIVVSSKETSQIIRKDASQILEKQVNASSEVAMSDAITTIEPKIEIPSESEAGMDKKILGNVDPNPKDFLKDKFDVNNLEEETKSSFRNPAKNNKYAMPQTAPLLVLDGKVQKQSVKEGLSKIDPDDVENIVELKEPLYIIDGHYYSEAELFGPNPTSPYAPLNEQEIETISILQGEKAFQNYGERGRKGVVVITIKNEIPVKTATKSGD